MAGETHDILVTGGTGFLGHYLLAELLHQPGVRCRVLLRPPWQDGAQRLRALLAELDVNTDSLRAEDRLRWVEGALPDGLDPLAVRGVTQILHAAANTSFDTDRAGEPARTNVEGTRALLRLADDVGAGRFVFVSTAYVCGRRSGRIGETVEAKAPVFANGYERSKWEAEQEVWRWKTESRVATICRPSILFGDRGTGRASKMTGFYLIARATEILARAVEEDPDTDRHHVPLRILSNGEDTANLVPVCWAARKIVAIALNPAWQGRVHHIINTDPPTHTEIKSWLEEYFDLQGGRFSDAAWPLEDPNHYEELFYSLGNIFHDYFRSGLFFESYPLPGFDPSDRLVDRALFFRCLRFAQARGWGRSRLEAAPRKSSPCAVDPHWYFEDFLPRMIPRSRVAQVEALTTVMRFVITGSKPGEWVCRFVEGRLAEVHEGPNTLREEFGYRVTEGDFGNVVRGCLTLQEIFFRGSGDMFGNLDKALKMIPLMTEFLKEFPVSSS